MSTNAGQQSAGTTQLLNRCTFSVTILNLLQVLLRLPEFVEDPTRIETKKLPPPWITWVFLALMHYRSLTSFANHIRRQLHGVAGGHDQLPGSDWHFSGGHPGFVHLCNEVTGEITAACDAYAWSDPIWVEDFILDVGLAKGPPTVYRRAKELFPDVFAMRVALKYLQPCGVLTDEDQQSDEIELSPDLQYFRDPCERFAEAWSNADDEARVKLAAAIGDFVYVDEVTPTAESKRQAEECKAEWLDVLRDEVSGELSDEAISALAHVGELEPHLDDLLSNASTADLAIQFVMDDPQYVNRIWDVFAGSEFGYGGCADYLLKHGHRVQEVIMKLNVAPYGNSYAVDMALKYAPEMLPELLHQGVRSDRGTTKEKAAAVLMLLNHDWCRQELATVLNESSDWPQTWPIRWVLHSSTDPAMREIAVQWEEKYPDSRPQRAETTGYPRNSMMSRLSDAVLKVRDQISTP